MFPNRKNQKLTPRAGSRGNLPRIPDSNSRALGRTCTPITNSYREGLNTVILPSRRGPAGVYRPLNKPKIEEATQRDSQFHRFAGKTLPSLRKSSEDKPPSLEEKSTASLPKYLNEKKSRSISRTPRKNIQNFEPPIEITSLKFLSTIASNNSSDVEIDSKSDFLNVTEESPLLSSDIEFSANPVRHSQHICHINEISDSVTTASIAAFRKISDRQLIQLQKNKLKSFATLEDQLNLEYFCKKKEVLQAEFELNFIKSHFGYISSSDSDTSAPSSKRYKFNDTNGNGSKDYDRSEKYLEDSSLISPLYIKWSDGEYIKLVCPQCGRIDFETYNEFSSHLKKRHDVEFSDIYATAVACGISVSDSEIAIDHPCRLPENILQNKSEVRKKTLCNSVEYNKFNEARRCLEADKPRIKVYDDVVDFDSFPLFSGHRTTSNRNAVKLKNSVRQMDSVSADINSSLDPAKSIFGSRPENALEINGAFGAFSCTDSNNSLGLNPCSDDVDSHSEESVHNDKKYDISPPGAWEVDSSISAQFGFNLVSRFHIQKTIVIGNTSKLVTEEPGASPHYRWLIFVTGPLFDPDISGFVSSVRFILHPTYAPDDVIEVKKAPFILPGFGWGEFPIRVQLFFSDPKNKTVELVHNLTLSDVDSKDQVSSSSFEIELDRDTKFTFSNKGSSLLKNMAVPGHLNGNGEDIKEPSSAPKAPLPNLAEQHFLILNSAASAFGLRHDIRKALIELLHIFPLVSSNLDYTLPLPYEVFDSPEQFYSSDSDHKQLTEWHRAKIITEYLNIKFYPSRECLKNSMVIDQLTVNQIIGWCRLFDPILLFDRKLNDANSLTIHNSKYYTCQGCFAISTQKAFTCKTCLSSIQNITSFSLPEPFLNSDNDQFITTGLERHEADMKKGDEVSIQNSDSLEGNENLISIIRPVEKRFISDTISQLQLPNFLVDSDTNRCSGTVSIAMATRLFLNDLLNRVLSKAGHVNSNVPGLNFLSRLESLNISLDSNSRHNTTPSNSTLHQTLTPIHIYEALVPPLKSSSNTSPGSFNRNYHHSFPTSNGDPMDFLTNTYIGAVIQ